jgi:ABC-type sulfate transport system permease component
MVSSIFIRQQIESGNTQGAAAVSVVLLALSLILLGAGALIQRGAMRHDGGTGTPPRRAAGDCGSSGSAT